MIGARGESIQWSRVAAFAIALFASRVVVWDVIQPLILGQSVHVSLQTWAFAALASVVGALAAVMAFRRVQSTALAAALAGSGYAAVMTTLHLLTTTTERWLWAWAFIASNWMWLFFSLIAMAWTVRTMRSLWWALSAGAAAGWLSAQAVWDVVEIVVRGGQSMSWTFELRYALLTVGGALVFGVVFSIALRVVGARPET